MTVRRVLVAVAAVAATVLPTATPAAAHGAPTNPMSRSAACGPEGPHASIPACRAAVRAGAALREWDNVRVFGVAGRDREKIPDGELCSGGLSAYQGLDLPRADWPATRLTAGATFTFRYRGTIPHRGTFRLYATLPGYDPQRRLTWDDLSPRPFLTITDPPLRSGSYQMRGQLPAGLTGRHLIYTVWQNSDSPDTYYSCSDVEFRAAAEVPPAARASDPPAAEAATPKPSVASDATAVPAFTAARDPGVPVASVTELGGDDLRLVIGGVAVTAVLVAVLAAMRLRRPVPVPPGRPCEVRNHRAGRRRTW
ncbi:lytic polysaccharide monooxygenase auxiliary activity family 9 protein [Micromonospora halophytica]|uniref:Chitin-binding protein n=1 Tax=Micromonospora halophytica TaxID=47864 RepID=A0A1C5HAS5_9ACTN|nr:lytic polysaccharide monooxygenase [Micromonospora halophytica]SCG43132.1 chitin-binding protein [Micromonospora halophytica]